MNKNHLNIYNNLIKLTRNKNLYLNLKNNDTFSDRLIILLFHFGFFLKIYKNEISKKEAQDLFDYFIRQIELSKGNSIKKPTKSELKNKNVVRKSIFAVKKIKKGDTVMIIEAMKTMNHVPSTSDGVVKEICVEDGQPVEFDQKIVILE